MTLFPVRQSSRTHFGVAFFALATACGITTPKYESYNDGTSTGTSTGNTDDACVNAAIAEFNAQVGARVSDNCAISGCHLTQPLAGKPLIAGNTANNRAQLLKYSGGDAAKLFNKISQNGTTHGGGDKSAALPKANIEAWLAKEAACTKSS